MSADKLKVIIAGAGIAGLAVAIALQRLPYLDVELYEQADELKEIGASIAISPNGLRSLEKLGVLNALDDDVAFRGPSEIPMIYRHWKTNEIILEEQFENVPLRRHQTARFHRGHLHAALLQHVPGERIHLNKKIVTASVHREKVTLHFADNTSAEGDILIGADGLKSNVRQSFAPEHKLNWTGKVFLRSTFDASLVQHIPDLPLDSVHWWGLKENFFASRLGKGQYTTVANFELPDVSEEQAKELIWDSKGDIEPVKERYKDWNPVVKSLIEATPYTRIYPNYAGDPLETWVFGSRVTLVGDAAHPHGGAFAAGGSLALDDAYTLLLAFNHVFRLGHFEPSKIKDVLELYQQTRKPHTEKLLNIVLKSIGQSSDDSSDEALRERVKNKPKIAWLSEHDVERAFSNVLFSAGHGISGPEKSRI
ncbi:hypothetical protein ASPWEDRAFT_186722 [Aspergillus wentii DTO 134E9]|uniref:FAD-binding domain-containing protein n=1 Tax=Aspergillus wentii DTO 134E9 TaxID=1073089 RepID=A0A1L9RCD8_ASPWE|nr:uncharacterized protein ASPWEDRAFT_186722 [Aspergillus wentii DTO 134E9]KAI9935117.1 hypothetical protein MW887_000738 [Aspergillus wentii]OJJ32558.1 hypothetical protein ASPWEDRAFT_186722 [Aspergillus wentii DTO 134E9]